MHIFLSVGIVLFGLTFQGQASVQKQINVLEAEKNTLLQGLKAVEEDVNFDTQIREKKAKIIALGVTEALREEYKNAPKNQKRNNLKFQPIRDENAIKQELEKLEKQQKAAAKKNETKARLQVIEEALAPLYLKREEEKKAEQEAEEVRRKEKEKGQAEAARIKLEKEQKEKKTEKRKKKELERKEAAAREAEEKRLAEERKQKQLEATRANQEKQRKEKELKEKDSQAARQLEAEKRERKAEEKRRQEAATARKEANRLEKEHKAKEEAEKLKNQGQKDEVGLLDAIINYTQAHPILIGSATAVVVLPTSVFTYFVVNKHAKLVKKQEKAIKEKRTFKYEDQNLWLVASKKVLGNMSEAVKRQGRKIRSLVKSNDKKVKTSEVA